MFHRRNKDFFSHESTPLLDTLDRGLRGLTHFRGRKNLNNEERIISLIGSGIMLASSIRRRDWMRLVSALVSGGLAFRGLTGHCSLYESLDMDTTRKPLRQELKRPLKRAGRVMRGWSDYSSHVVDSIVVRKPVEEVYTFWRDFANLPRFMNHLKAVRMLDDTRSEWTAYGPLGTEITWLAEINEEEKNKRIAWQSIDNEHLVNSGRVEFFPLNNTTTNVTVSIQYQPPGGKVGEKVASFLVNTHPAEQVRESLHTVKALLEKPSAAKGY